MIGNLKYSGIAYLVNVEPTFVDASLDTDPATASFSYRTSLGCVTLSDLQNVA